MHQIHGLFIFFELLKDLFFLIYSQNNGGCAVQNNQARCWCSDSYQGYYCQYSMLRIGLII